VDDLEKLMTVDTWFRQAGWKVYKEELKNRLSSLVDIAYEHDISTIEGREAYVENKARYKAVLTMLNEPEEVRQQIKLLKTEEEG
jgi:hypothetical protein